MTNPANPVRPVNSRRNLAAFWSFLRVLLVAEASALLPLWVGAGDYPTLKAMGLAAVPAFLLTVINYLRPGETRFGIHEPNVRRAGDGGAITIGGILGLIVTVLLILLLLRLLGVV